VTLPPPEELNEALASGLLPWRDPAGHKGTFVFPLDVEARLDDREQQLMARLARLRDLDADVRAAEVAARGETAPQDDTAPRDDAVDERASRS
jgi:hypothetical protein